MTNILAMAVVMTNALICSSNMSSCGWNFVINAKHLTKQEKEYYNSRAEVADRLRPYGGSVGVIAEEVEAIDRWREMKEQMTTNTNTVRWLGSVVFEFYKKDGPNGWESLGDRIHGKMSDPQTEIGLRSLGFN